MSSPVLHATLPHLVTNMATLMADGSELESRVGSAGMLGAVTAIGALSQGIYGGPAVWLAWVVTLLTGWQCAGGRGNIVLSGILCQRVCFCNHGHSCCAALLR